MKSYPTGTMIFIQKRRKPEKSTRLFLRKDGKVISAHALSINSSYLLERNSFNRTINDPGDGHCFFWKWSPDGTIHNGIEWFEVIQVYDNSSVSAQDIQSFMLVYNKLKQVNNFDPKNFLRNLNMGQPSEELQRKMASNEQFAKPTCQF